MKKQILVGCAFGLAFISLPVLGDEQAAIDGCIDQVRTVGGPDASDGGRVLSSDFSEASTLVMLEDGGGTLWRCIAYSNGTVADLSVVDAMDDGGGAMSGAAMDDGNGAMAGSNFGYMEEGSTSTVRVHFPRGASGVDLVGRLTPGSSVNYVLGANNGQFLNVELFPEDPGLSYQIFNPDGTALLDLVDARTPYRGQLWQSGDHTVEVVNRGHRNASYDIDFWID